MIEIRDKQTQRVLGTIDQNELQFLVDELEEESEDDRDYWIDEPTLQMLEADGAAPRLVQMLRRALGDREGIEIVWG
ncbi:MAG: galactosyldiacylglycerol synthase [Acidobacteria bacterium]|nr:galactosyldiacylglycerol synthase [Acidobacteriota bacterium]